MTLAISRSHVTRWPPDASFRAVVRDGGTVELVGELDITGVAALREALDQALLEQAETLQVDATAVNFIDSAALSELLYYQLVAAAQQRRLVVDPSPQMATVLELLDLGPALTGSLRSLD